MKNAITIRFTQFFLLCVFFGSWELLTFLNIADAFYISSPSKIIAVIFQWHSSGLLWGNLLLTLSEALAGLLIGIILGVLLAVGFTFNPFLNKVFQPFLSVINALPRIAFAPLIVLWFGFGLLSKVIIVVSLVFFIVFFSVYNGLNDIDKTIIKNAKVLGASKTILMKHIYGPCAVYWVFVSLRLSLGYAIIAAIIGEYVGASGGVGFLIDNAQSMFDATGVMSGLTILTICVYIMDIGLNYLEPHFLKWRDTATR